MRNLCLALFASFLMVGCENSFESHLVEKMTESAFDGVCIIDDWIEYRDGKEYDSSADMGEGPVKNQWSQVLDLVFFANGECRQCYCDDMMTGVTIPYPYLYTTLTWEIDTDTDTIILTNPELKEKGDKGAVTRLKLLSCKLGDFILVGNTPSKNGFKEGDYHRLYGHIGTPEERAEYLEKYLDEKVYKPLNDAAYEEVE